MTASRRNHSQPVPSFEFGGRAFKPKPVTVRKHNKRPKIVRVSREIVTEVLNNGEPVNIRYGYEDQVR